MSIEDPTLEARAAILAAIRAGHETAAGITGHTALPRRTVEWQLYCLHREGAVTPEYRAVPGRRGNMQTRWRATVGRHG